MLPEFLSYEEDGLVLYKAGRFKDTAKRGYEENFSRDVLESGLMRRDPLMIRDQLIFGNSKISNSKDPISSAELWKYHHQNPGVLLNNGLSTEYNATDAVALYLLGHDLYQQTTGDKGLTQRFFINLFGATYVYALNHLNSRMQFEENPSYSGAVESALKRTDWKDSFVPLRPEGRAIGSVVYPIIQAQYMAAFRAASNLFETPQLTEVSDQMREGLNHLFDDTKGNFLIAADKFGPIKGINSDGLNMFFYLNPEDLTPKMLLSVIESSEVLETGIGYLNIEPEIGETLEDDYHYRVWPKEQAAIFLGADKFLQWATQNNKAEYINPLMHVKEVATRCYPFIGDGAETLKERDGQVIAEGPDYQLWSIVASEILEKEYFRIHKVAA